MNAKERLLRYYHHEEITPPEIMPEHLPVNLPYCERPMWTSGYDAWGVHWTKSIEGCHYTSGQPYIVKDIENWENEVRIPDAGQMDWDYLKRQTQEVDRVNTLIDVCLMMGPLERASVFTSFDDCLANTLIYPERMYNLFGAIADFRIQVIHKVAKIVQPDVINLHDDWGYNQSQLISPLSWRGLIKPHVARMYQAIKEHGILVCQHSCGNVRPMLDDIVELGADIWEGQERCNDFNEIHATFGSRLRFAVLSHTPEGDDTYCRATE